MVDHSKIGAAVAYFEQFRLKLIQDQDFTPFTIKQVPSEFCGDEEHNTNLLRVLNKWLGTLAKEEEQTYEMPPHTMHRREFQLYGGRERTWVAPADIPLTADKDFDLPIDNFLATPLSFKFPGFGRSHKPTWSLPATHDKINWGKCSLRITISQYHNLQLYFSGFMKHTVGSTTTDVPVKQFFEAVGGFQTVSFVPDDPSEFDRNSSPFTTDFPEGTPTSVIEFKAGSFSYDDSKKLITATTKFAWPAMPSSINTVVDFFIEAEVPSIHTSFGLNAYTTYPLDTLMEVTATWSYRTAQAYPQPYIELESLVIKPEKTSLSNKRKLMWTVVEDAKSPPLSWTVAKGLTIKFNPYLKSTPFPRRYDSFIKLEEFKVVYTGAPRPTPINPIPSPLIPGEQAPVPLLRPNIFPSLVYKQLILNLPDPRTFQHWTRKNAFHFCPFQIVGGAKFSTEAGRKGLNARVTDYSQIQTVFSGEDTVNVIWEKSYKPLLGEGKESFDKIMSTGTSYLAYVLEESLTTNFTSFTAQTTMTSLQVMKTFRCQVPYTAHNRRFFENAHADAQSFLYVIPEFAQSTTLVDRIDIFKRMQVNRTYFKIQNLTVERSKDNDKRFLYAEVTFQSLNAELNKTGLALNVAVQNGLPGEAVAYPSLSSQGEVMLNPPDFVYVPVQASQIFINGMAGLCSLYQYGTPITQRVADALLHNHRIQYTRPGMLAWYKIMPPTNDPFNLKKSPVTDFFITYFSLDVLTNMTALRDIRNVFSGQLSANEIEAFIKTNVADTQATNEHGNPLPPWNVAWGAKLSSIYSSLGVYDVRGNDMFQYQHKGKFIGNKYFDWRKVTHKDFPHFLFFNSLILKTIPVLPIQQDEIVGLTTGIFNFIANVLKIFTFGLSSGWRRPTITDYPHATKFPMVIPRSIYEKYLEIFKRTPTGNFVTRLGDILYLPAKQISAKNQVLATSIKEGLLPLGMFQHSEEAINTWLGAKDTTIALAGLLTNKITTTLYAVNDGRSNLQKYTVTLADIGQVVRVTTSQFQDEPFVPLINETSHLQPPSAALSDYSEAPADHIPLGYMIHAHGGHFLGGMNSIMKFYSYPKGTIINELDDDHTVWIDNFKTMSAYNSNVRLWFNFHRLGNPLFKFNEKLKYPDDLKPPNYNPGGTPPSPYPQPVYDIDVGSFVYGDVAADTFYETNDPALVTEIDHYDGLYCWADDRINTSWGGSDYSGGTSVLNVSFINANKDATSSDVQSTKNNFVFDSTKLRILKATAEVTLQLFFEIVVNSRYGKGVWYKQLYEPVSTFVNFESNVSKKTLTATATLYPHDIYFDTSVPNTFDRASFRSYKALLYQHHYGWRNSRRPIHLDRVSFSTGHSVLTYTRATPPHSNIAVELKWDNNKMYLNRLYVNASTSNQVMEVTTFATTTRWSVKGTTIKLNLVNLSIENVKVKVEEI